MKTHSSHSHDPLKGVCTADITYLFINNHIALNSAF